MASPAQVRVTDTAERRQGSRLVVESDSTVRADKRAVDVIVSDLSETGCAIKGSLELAIGDEISVGLVGFGTFEAKVVRKNGDIVGCEFFQPVDAHIISNAFGASTVIIASVASVPPENANIPGPDLDKWSRANRVLFLGTSSILLWALIATAIAICR